MAGAGQATCSEHRRIKPAYIAVRAGGALAFRYDPARRIVEWQHKGERHYFDLAELEEQAQALDNNVKS